MIDIANIRGYFERWLWRGATFQRRVAEIVRGSGQVPHPYAG